MESTGSAWVNALALMLAFLVPVFVAFLLSLLFIVVAARYGTRAVLDEIARDRARRVGRS